MEPLKLQYKKKLLGVVTLIIFLCIPILGIVSVQATAQISPDTGSFEMGLPVYINIQGLTADTRYTIYTVQGTTETLIVNMTSSTAGKIAISVLFTETGEGRIEVRDITGVTTTVSANYLITDTFNDQLLPILMWVAVIVIGVSVVIGIILYMKKAVKF